MRTGSRMGMWVAMKFRISLVIAAHGVSRYRYMGRTTSLLCMSVTFHLRCRRSANITLHDVGDRPAEHAPRMLKLANLVRPRDDDPQCPMPAGWLRPERSSPCHLDLVHVATPKKSSPCQLFEEVELNHDLCPRTRKRRNPKGGSSSAPSGGFLLRSRGPSRPAPNPMTILSRTPGRTT